MLVNSSGYIDIIEIKKPFENDILSQKEYRDNYYPLRELSGTIMQAEKYIYLLSRYAVELEVYCYNNPVMCFHRPIER